MVTRTGLNVTLYVHCVSCYFKQRNVDKIQRVNNRAGDVEVHKFAKNLGAT